jgi:hypothetical protein
MIDTLAIVDELTKSGFEEVKARAICATMTSNQFSTISDIEKLKIEIEHRFDKLDNKLNMLTWLIGVLFAAIYGLKLLS